MEDTSSPKVAVTRNGPWQPHAFKEGDRVVALEDGPGYQRGQPYTVYGYNDLGNLVLDIPGRRDAGVYQDDFAPIKKSVKRLRCISLKGLDAEERAWNRGYKWAMENGYDYRGDWFDPEWEKRTSQSIRDCRLIAMAYAKGWTNGRKSRRK